MTHLIIVIASFLTTIKSTWELSRMVREKRAAKTPGLCCSLAHLSMMICFHLQDRPVLPKRVYQSGDTKSRSQCPKSTYHQPQHIFIA
ncbi:hypothetical protein C8A01DRAFT_20117 [Parachaetomium inaequale]|uniref:Secreted protein n=1 Tax=Parachaetomium inaequale TaxID=2588326 RepID=A0AAN6P8R1_9PEZI|nr:hypothetical protein C8A01DRAFT_20117 [Parachaetomium inaequale]